ncbi:C3HC zinc finger-like-domain-containing protein [Schizophyllum amplum]|uniref:C3HC zinc finger-like-domain-containing protein n=1 Tax=Schizophyllum amplum TaxID=97359 RepID=A0A550CJY0_9AGAR|nr:C3HC zinc finger-like-domain-containing protein [Auriculariopsis ampla]
MASFPSISSPIPAPQISPNDVQTAQPPSASAYRAQKRKLDDAFSSLDSAIGQEEARPPPSKRTNTSRSFLTTLSRYGVISKQSNAIISRAKSTFRAPTTGPVTPHGAYRPSSVTSFLERLATFKIATYSGKPKALEASAAAAAGWVNDGKDRLVCGICNASWNVAGREGLSRDAANTLVEKQRVALIEAHKEGCPWRKRQCDATIYRIPLQSPQTMVRAMKTNAIILNASFTDVRVKHPLSATQLSSLRQTVANFVLPVSEGAESDPPLPQPCEAAVLASLFGWSLPPPTERAPSLSRAGSSTRRTPSISRATSPSVSRRATPAPGAASISRPGTPTPGGSAIQSAFLPLASSSLSIALSTSRGTAAVGDVVHCVLCQRRVGLWAFRAGEGERESTNGAATLANGTSVVEGSTPAPANGTPAPRTPSRPTSRQFDLLKEHRAFCPYVVQSTVVPSMQITPPSMQPASSGSGFDQHRRSGSTSSLSDPNAPVEGWRAVLTIVLRYGASRRLRERMGIEEGVETAFGEATPEGAVDTASVDSTGVDSMVADVKKRGGRELLKYVKGLIG